MGFPWLPGINKMELCKARISNGFTSRLEACQFLPEIQSGQFLWVTMVAENQGLARKIQFRIHTGITLNMKRDLCTV